MLGIQAMTAEIPEMRSMIEAARRYLLGECTIQELNGHASECSTVARLFGAHPAIKKTADEWVAMIYRRWNEWGDVKQPLSEEAFRAWLQEQLI